MMPWLPLVDECHAAGFIGATGKRNTRLRVMGRVDIITGTLGKAG
jgi:glycine C-acetyltransferase